MGFEVYATWPSGKREYLMNYGWHFSKKAFLFAAKLMTRKDTNDKEVEVKPFTQDEIEELLKKHNIKLKNNKGYDAVYVATMCRADNIGSAIEDDLHLAKFVKDFLDDPDGYEDKAFKHWALDMISKGIPIDWEEML